jgi:hypothetical protein
MEHHAAVVAESPHKTARQRHEAPLVEADEADHVADDNGSTMVRGCWGAMRVDKEAKNREQEEL